jgi:predicted  nucleic acid-binding Zn-ribbon protein
VPAKTNTDAIRDLEKLAATLQERLDNTREDVRRNRDEIGQFNLAQTEATGRLRLLEEKLLNLRQGVEEADRRRFQFLLLFIGSLITLAINVLLTLTRR